MATSGSTNFTRTRDELINGALRLIGKAGRGKTASAADISDAAEALELMIKAWQATPGFQLWKLKEATLFVTKGTADYSLPGANCTLSYVETDVKVAGVATDLTIDVDSITGMSDGDYIGIELDSGSLHWTTINGAPAGDTVTITDALPSAVAVDRTVYVYTTQIIRPLRVVDARRKDSSDVPIDVVTRQEYYELPNKTSTGSVNQVYYDPQLTTGTLHIWPAGNDADDKIELTLMYPIEDFDSSNINADFPQEWLKAIKFNLAADLGPEYGLDLNRQGYLDRKAKQLLDDVSDFDSEVGSVYFEIEG